MQMRRPDRQVAFHIFVSMSGINKQNGALLTPVLSYGLSKTTLDADQVFDLQLAQIILEPLEDSVGGYFTLAVCR